MWVSITEVRGKENIILCKNNDGQNLLWYTSVQSNGNKILTIEVVDTYVGIILKFDSVVLICYYLLLQEL
jgi:hypothetical protein